ncbi:amidohydrolase family protein [Streptomyces cadmiisoli]|uniref:amidohydrolase family protein n=1 Tax=Streptomyces cadmiisoli TaxID=2184053 RepID=UPI003648791F
MLLSGTIFGLYVSVGGGPAREHEALAACVEAILDTYGALHKLGADVVIGSDAGIGPVKPHNLFARGVVDLARLGVVPLDALKSMTSLAARPCRTDGRKGRIAASADADLLVVNGDLERDPAAVLDVPAVFRSGIRVC